MGAYLLTSTDPGWKREQHRNVEEYRINTLAKVPEEGG